MQREGNAFKKCTPTDRKITNPLASSEKFRDKREKSVKVLRQVNC